MEGNDGFDSHTLPPVMPSKPKKSKRRFRASNEARRQAREVLGTPPATRVQQDRRRKPPKHKKKLEEEMA